MNNTDDSLKCIHEDLQVLNVILAYRSGLITKKKAKEYLNIEKKINGD